MCAPDSLHFPADVVRALDRITRNARVRNGFFMHRRANRRGRRDLGLRDADAWGLLASLAVADFHAGPQVDRHAPDRELWIFAPLVGERRAYLKVAFCPDDPLDETTLVIWSIHPARFTMHRPFA
jgi:hypothetical protein